MLKVIVFALCVVVVLTAPPPPGDVVPIVKQESSVEADGHYHYSYESGDGTKQEQTGELKGSKDEPGEAVAGSFEYVGDDGKVVKVEYTADENGYVPHGDGIPGIPEPIQRALKWAEEHPYKEEDDKKKAGR